MRVLVTGGAGFLGSHLCDALLAQGHTVVCVDNLLTGSAEEHRAPEANRASNFASTMFAAPSISVKIDYVFHFASPASPVDYLEHAIETLQVGSLGTMNCLELAKKHGAKFFMASTSECYGDPLEHPQKETYWGHVNPIGPRSVYDEAKRFAEAITMAYHRYHKVDTHIVRIFNTYGPRLQLNDGRVISNFMKQALARRRAHCLRRRHRRPAASATSATRSRESSRWPIPTSTSRQHRQSGRVHHPGVRAGGAGGDRLKKQDPLRAAATGRSQAAPSRHQQGKAVCWAGSRGSICATGLRLSLEYFRTAVEGRLRSG